LPSNIRPEVAEELETKTEARRIAANITKLSELLQKVARGNLAIQQFDLTQRIINQVCVHIVLKVEIRLS
jgi:hypothetical protein